MRCLGFSGPATVLVCLIHATVAQAVVVGQIDTFEDGTTQNWAVALLGMGHPAPPSNVATGGPAGTNDNFLLLTALGGSDAGSRLTVINVTQWTGDYAGQGVGAISMDVNNFGSTSLSLRLYFADPSGGPPSNTAISTSVVVVPSGSGWQTVVFPIAQVTLTPLTGNLTTLLSNTTELRLVHSASGTFPGEAIAAVLGVDNIQALASSGLPVPGLGSRSLAILTVAVAMAGALALLRRGSVM